MLLHNLRLIHCQYQQSFVISQHMRWNHFITVNSYKKPPYECGFHTHPYMCTLYILIYFYLRINYYYMITNIFPQLPLTLHFSCHDKIPHIYLVKQRNKVCLLCFTCLTQLISVLLDRNQLMVLWSDHFYSIRLAVPQAIPTPFAISVIYII